MTHPLGAWRVTYTPGDWTVLAGPTSLVVIEPFPAKQSDLVSLLWLEVVASSSITDLASRVASYGLDDMPSFAAFFWAKDGMRSLVRGAVSVMNLTSGQIVADGDGVQTWTEVGLSGVDQVRVDLQAAGAGGIELPLVVGAVRASSVVLDARPESQVSSPQPTEEVDQPKEQESPPGVPEPPPAEPERKWWEADVDFVGTAVIGTAAAGDSGGSATEYFPAPSPDVDEDADTELLQMPAEVSQAVAESAADQGGIADSSSGPPTPEYLPGPSPIPPPPPPGVVGQYDQPAYALPPGSDAAAVGEALVLGVLCPKQHSNSPRETTCRVCRRRIRKQTARMVPRGVLARLRGPDGGTVELDRPVLIGRAPSPDQTDTPAARLMTVPSASQDISRSHVRVSPEGWEVLVTDLNSTNGTTLVLPGQQGNSRRLHGGDSTTVPIGSVLELGEGVRILIETLDRDPRSADGSGGR
ncbi:MAG TPA: FHA domain-containing protein [Propionibacteriaceae bacterium]|nr:FHA domain-containing protein [Propionibacteriaceae bacterium]